MFLINGFKATLRQYNRVASDSVYDDRNFKEVPIKCCPYDVDHGIKFDTYTTREATGFYQVPRHVDVREGDQIIFNKTPDNVDELTDCVHTVLKVEDSWIFNRIENKVLAIK